MTKLPPTFRRNLGIQRAEVAHLIRHEMNKRGYSGKTLAEELKITPAAVSRTITGLIHSTRVLDALQRIGVPKKLLFDPRNATLPPVQGEEEERKAG